MLFTAILCVLAFFAVIGMGATVNWFFTWRIVRRKKNYNRMQVEGIVKEISDKTKIDEKNVKAVVQGLGDIMMDNFAGATPDIIAPIFKDAAQRKFAMTP